MRRSPPEDLLDEHANETKPKLLTVLDIVTVLMLVIATGMVFFYAPMEAVMGQVQRVFYFHVSRRLGGHARLSGRCRRGHRLSADG